MREAKPSSQEAPPPASALQRWVRALGGARRSPSAHDEASVSRDDHRASNASRGDGPRLPQVELSALLDAVPGSRKSLRHLTAVENGLKRKDPTGMFLFHVDPNLLRIALRQLDGLSPATPTRGLSALRSRIVAAIEAHDKREKTREMLAPRSDLMQVGKVEVAEIGASDFDRLSEQWRGKQPDA
jgi:hypothetical protein